MNLNVGVGILDFIKRFKDMGDNVCPIFTKRGTGDLWTKPNKSYKMDSSFSKLCIPENQLEYALK